MSRLTSPCGSVCSNPRLRWDLQLLGATTLPQPWLRTSDMGVLSRIQHSKLGLCWPSCSSSQDSEPCWPVEDLWVLALPGHARIGVRSIQRPTVLGNVSNNQSQSRDNISHDCGFHSWLLLCFFGLPTIQLRHVHVCSGLTAFMDWHGGSKTSTGIMWFGSGALLGWPFSGALIIPFVVEEWLIAIVGQADLFETFRSYLDGFVRCLIVLALQVSIDTFFYHKVVVVLGASLRTMFSAAMREGQTYSEQSRGIYYIRICCLTSTSGSCLLRSRCHFTCSSRPSCVSIPQNCHSSELSPSSHRSTSGWLSSPYSPTKKRGLYSQLTPF